MGAVEVALTRANPQYLLYPAESVVPQKKNENETFSKF